jgi:lysophospholipase L1-like esterase
MAAGRGRETALALASLCAGLLAAEAVARVWVARRWPAEEVRVLTQETAVRGRYTLHPQLGYVLTPGYTVPGKTHDRQGFRGPDFEPAKPAGTLRVVLLGASTIYGVRVGDDETSARRLEALLAPRLAPSRIEVVNAGVPGWTSRETRLNLALRVLDLAPDAIVVLDGRNEIFPQLFRGYRDDYTHFRDVESDVLRSQAGYKRAFRLSRLAFVLAARGDGHFGFSVESENPVYATIRWDMKPDVQEALGYAGDPRRLEGYRLNLEAEVALARERGVVAALATLPFRPEGWASGVLPPDPRLLPVYTDLVARNNETVREVARATRALLVDVAPRLATPAFMPDDCHFLPAGEEAFAAAMADVLAEPLRRRAATVESVDATAAATTR